MNYYITLFRIDITQLKEIKIFIAVNKSTGQYSKNSLNVQSKPVYSFTGRKYSLKNNKSN